MAIETTGVLFGPRTTEFLKELGHRLRWVSDEANSFAYLTQSPETVSCRPTGNAASVLGTVKVDSEDEEFFCISFIVLFYCNVNICSVILLYIKIKI